VTFYLNGHEIRVTRADCVASYTLPRLYPFSYPFRTPDGSADMNYHYPVEVQLGDDFSLRLLDKAGRPVPQEPMKAASLKGSFPLMPRAVKWAAGRQ
jgi:hypothetical protein